MTSRKKKPPRSIELDGPSTNVQVRLTFDIHKDLSAYVRLAGYTMSAYIRKLIIRDLESKEGKKVAR